MSQKLVVLMLDGFRWDYIERDRDNLRSFVRLMEEGVHCEHLEPICPVLSYPNWTSMVTGTYAGQHGITGNHMWDKTRECPLTSTFQLMNHETTTHSHWWEVCPEPIWITATKKGLRTFTRFWSRSDLPYDGVSVEESSAFASAPTIQDLTDTLDIGIQKLQEGFDLIMLYTDLIDQTGHKYGPDAETTKQAIRDVDLTLGRFLDKLNELGEDINLILLSDHGMTSTSPTTGTTFINLDDYITHEDVERVLDYGAYICVAPAPGQSDYVIEKLRRMDGVTVYKKEEIPDELHLKEGKFMLDILVTAKPGYYIRGLKGTDKQVPHCSTGTHGVHDYEGMHGYLPGLHDQHGIFLARGPAFKKGHSHPPITMVDVYQIFTKVLEITPHQHEGVWERVQGLFFGS